MCVCIKFYFKLGKTTPETYMLKIAFAEAARRKTHKSELFSKFKIGLLLNVYNVYI